MPSQQEQHPDEVSQVLGWLATLELGLSSKVRFYCDIHHVLCVTLVQSTLLRGPHDKVENAGS